MRRLVWVMVFVAVGVVGWRIFRRPPPPPPAPVAQLDEEPDPEPPPPTPDPALGSPKGASRPPSMGKQNDEWTAWKKKIFDARLERRKRLNKLAAEDKNAFLNLPEIARAGQLPKEYVSAAMDEMKPLVEECLNLGLGHDQTLRKRVTTYFQIDAEPDVGGVFSWAEAVAGMGHDEPHLFECLQESAKTVKLPPPQWGGRTQWGFTFDFNEKKFDISQGSKKKDGGA